MNLKLSPPHIYPGIQMFACWKSKQLWHEQNRSRESSIESHLKSKLQMLTVICTASHRCFSISFFQKEITYKLRQKSCFRRFHCLIKHKPHITKRIIIGIGWKKKPKTKQGNNGSPFADCRRQRSHSITFGGVDFTRALIRNHMHTITKQR